MNGRLYDTKLHRFLQTDNYVQDVSSTQNYNRYGYVLNNPLKYTDPSGERWKINWNDIIAGVAIIAGAAITIFSLGIAAPIGYGLIGAGVAHFGATYAEYTRTGDWNAASNNAGISFSYSQRVDWLDGSTKTDVNGVTQTAPVVKPIAADDVRNMSSGNLSAAQEAIIKARTKAQYINLSDPKQYPGINIFQNKNISDDTAVTLPGFGIYIGGGYQGSDLKMVIQHEYGHFLDYQFGPDLSYNGLNLVNYYFKIGLPSIINMGFGIGGAHDTFWTEIRANQWATIWFGKNLHPNFIYYYPTKK